MEERLEKDRVEPDEETGFSEVTGRTANDGGEVAGKAMSLARRVGEAVSRATFGAREWAGEKAGRVFASTAGTTEDPRYDASHIASTLATGISKIAEHKHSAEARDLVDASRQAAGNVGVVFGSGVVWHPGVAAARSGSKCVLVFL
ncbi:hypothetical protein HOY80DRAFT_1039249 [Tuber brumale]|nr:hypothetical protein HOY80DRAFT_1039249 [Tuber brumale]